MIIIDSETRYRGENYKAIGAEGEEDEEFLYFAQPVDSMLKAHRDHDKALNSLLDREFEEDDDARVIETSIQYGYEEF